MVKTATLWIGVGVLAAIVLNAQIVGIVDPILSKAKLSVALAG
jgi:hypothetical protein